jgi:thiopeptide-type bacteriocin biosynthesis protein
MENRRWKQINVTFPDWGHAEKRAVEYLAPLLETAENDGLITSWFFVRKAPCWRVRYTPGVNTTYVRAYIHRHLQDLQFRQIITGAAEIIYEPECHAFGGDQGMESAHRLFYLDSKHLLGYIAGHEHLGTIGHRRELSILLCTALLRAAGLDWYEQGDVWARVAEHRDTPAQLPANKLRRLENDLRRLMSVDTTSLMSKDAPLEFAAEWAEAYAVAGRELAGLAASGRLHRGLRAVLAHHIIFAWNRLGLPHPAQALIANTAKVAMFGLDPSVHRASTEGKNEHERRRQAADGRYHAGVVPSGTTLPPTRSTS